MSRWKASGMHLLISAVIGVVVFSVLFFLWYPGPLLKITGGHRLVLLLIGVDLVLGPLLTLAVYKHGKRGMRFDLTVIALLQAAALTYGLSVVLIGRPAYLVFDGDQFFVVHANSLISDSGAANAYDHPGFGGPVAVALVIPDDPVERSSLTMKALQGLKLERVTRLYGPYEHGARRAVEKGAELTELRAKGPSASAAVDRVQAEHPGARLVMLPLIDATETGAIVLGRDNGNILGMLEFDPR